MDTAQKQRIKSIKPNNVTFIQEALITAAEIMTKTYNAALGISLEVSCLLPNFTSFYSFALRVHICVCMAPFSRFFDF